MGIRAGCGQLASRDTSELSVLPLNMPLHDYGTPIRSYQGTGTLHLTSGTPVACSFEAAQFQNGDVLILSYTTADVFEDDASTRLTGQTTQGWSLDAEFDVPTNVLGDHTQSPPGTYFAHRATRLRVTVAPEAPTAYRYGIVNCRFFGNDTFTTYDAAGAATAHRWRLVLDLAHEQGPVTVCLEPLADYSHLAQTISTTRGIAVTCEAVIDATSLQPGIDPDDIVADLCLVLSVARGTFVQWLHRRDIAASGEVASNHVSHITRRFQGMEPLDHRPLRRADTKRFVEGAYAALPQISQIYGVRRGLVLAYIDARSEDDALEMRGVKLAVVAEMIKAQHQGANIIPNAPWTWAWLRSLWQRLRQSRHPRFATALRNACRAAGYRPSRSTVGDFVATRNRLVHAGRFRADPISPVPGCRFASPAEEYMFLLSFIDRFFLRLFGYTGPFIDWSRYPQHEQGTV